MKNLLKFALLATLAVLLAGTANAQLIAQTNATVTVQVQAQSFLTITPTGGSLIFDPVAGTTNTVNLQASWNLPNTWTSVTFYAYFGSASAALSTSAGSTIPSSAIAASIGGTNASGPISGQACTRSTGADAFGAVDGATCQPQPVGLSNDGLSSANQQTSPINFTLSLALLGYANNGLHLAAGTYNGTLNAVLVAI